MGCWQMGHVFEQVLLITEYIKNHSEKVEGQSHGFRAWEVAQLFVDLFRILINSNTKKKIVNDKPQPPPKICDGFFYF